MKFVKKTDVIIVLILGLVGIVVWYIYHTNYSKKPAKAEIYYQSQLIKTVALDKGTEQRFSIPQNDHVVFYLDSDGNIAFESSDCPDKVCVKTGKLRSVGQTAACLPNEIILKIVPVSGHSEDDIDMMIGR